MEDAMDKTWWCHYRNIRVVFVVYENLSDCNVNVLSIKLLCYKILSYGREKISWVKRSFT